MYQMFNWYFLDTITYCLHNSDDDDDASIGGGDGAAATAVIFN